MTRDVRLNFTRSQLSRGKTLVLNIYMRNCAEGDRYVIASLLGELRTWRDDKLNFIRLVE
jgi:hypothetical protein